MRVLALVRVRVRTLVQCGAARCRSGCGADLEQVLRRSWGSCCWWCSRHAVDELAARHPGTHVDASALYLDHGDVLTSPAAWVRSRRLDEARRLLETTDLSVERVAAACGFGSAVTLRQNFAASFASTPTSYRRRFSTEA